MRQVIIGKEGNQPFVLTDPSVSRKHAILQIDDERGVITLTDTSTNGTFIYKGTHFERLAPNQPTVVYPNTMIRLGPETRFHVQKAIPPKPAAPEKPKVKRVSIAHLRDISDNYINTKTKLDTRQNNLNNLRSLTIVVGVVAPTLSALFIKDKEVDIDSRAYVTLIIYVVLVGALILFISYMTKKVVKDKNNNEHDYAVKYCCPHCHHSFRGKYYENILAGGKCPNCKSEFYE